jgi:hypothetical protein
VLHPVKLSFLGAAGREFRQTPLGSAHGQPQQGDGVDGDVDSEAL